MKKWILFLALILLLTGCAGNTGEGETTGETKPQGYYVSGSKIETDTSGAILSYTLPQGNYVGLSGIGDQVVLLGENQELTLLTGVEGIPTANFTVPYPGGQVLYTGYSYYDAQQKQVVFLNAQFHETSRLSLPQEVEGDPVVTPDASQVFYIQGQEIRCLEVERKLDRLVKSHSYQKLSLTGCGFDGKILICQSTDAHKKEKTLYISSESGQTMSEENHISTLYTYENSYLALRTDGVVAQWIVGTLDGMALQLTAAEPNVIGALELGGVVCWTADENGTLTLSFYEIANGKKTATVSVSNTPAPSYVYADRWNSCVWILCQDGKTLLRWQIKESPVTEEVSYLGTLFTAENPDKAGLEACSDRAKSINKKNGIYVRLWDNALKNPGQYTLEPEYQIEAIEDMLTGLETVLGKFPKNFVKHSISSRLRICLVRSVDGEQKAVQYWEKDSAYIAISAGMNVEEAFIKLFGYVVDSHVLGNSSDYDYWSKLNPEGFVYGGDNQNQQYLTGEGQCFTSEKAMTAATEDRNELFYYALATDNAQLFQKTAMQKKLRAMCIAIRDAWRLRKSSDAFPWEQYLQEPIAYKK